MTTIIAFIVIFCILVVVHEFGHFYFAKRSGILVREFSIGMGPEAMGVAQEQYDLHAAVATPWRIRPHGWLAR